jgi:hypothetical protein
MSWSTKKRLQILTVFAVFLAVIIGLFSFFIFYKSPTCFDGKQNGDEVGIDCGGSCQYLCQNQAENPIIKWQRTFRLSEGVWSSLAYIENPNKEISTKNVHYVFKVYDSENILIYEKKGETSIPPGKSFAVFENGIGVGERIPSRTIFEFTENPKWTRNASQEPELAISRQDLSQVSSKPRLDVAVLNKGKSSVSNVELTAIIYDKNGNVIGASRTIVDSINGGETAEAVFTWPEPFFGEPFRTEMIYITPK